MFSAVEYKISELRRRGVVLQISKINLSSMQQTTLGEDGKYPIASLYKFILLLESINRNPSNFWNREVTISPDDHAPGYGIMRGCNGAITTTLGNLAVFTLFNSDGTAAEILFNSDKALNKFALPYAPSENTLLSKHHSDMVTSSGLHWEKLSLEMDPKIRQEKLIRLVSDPSTIGGYTSARDFSMLIAARFALAMESSPFFRSLVAPGTNRAIRSSRRMFAAFPKNVHWIGKTGTLGFGYILNDSGIIFKDGLPSEAIAVTSYGWESPIEESEIEISRISFDFWSAGYSL